MPKTFYSQGFQEALSREYIFIDNDCLNEIYTNAILLKELSEDFALKKIYIYPFTEFEFLRNIPVLKIRQLKEKFIVSPFFGKISSDDHMKYLPRFIDNALLLSKLYALEKYKGDSSFIDLLLGGLLMSLPTSSAIITGNKKDFPSCVFDTLGVLNLELENDYYKTMFILAFNKDKFEKCNNKLEEADTKQEANLK